MQLCTSVGQTGRCLSFSKESGKDLTFSLLNPGQSAFNILDREWSVLHARQTKPLTFSILGLQLTNRVSGKAFPVPSLTCHTLP